MDDLFRSTRLEVLVPEQRVHLDVLDTGSPRWWSNLSTMPQRKQAFFGERVSDIVSMSDSSAEV